jgi:hypothetical protein
MPAVLAGLLLSPGLFAQAPGVEPAPGGQAASTGEAVTAPAGEALPAAGAGEPGTAADRRPPEMPVPAPFSTQKLDPEVAEALKEHWGVELLGIRNTAAGNFLDFRFRVVDAEKALPLFDHRIKPYLIAERSNIKLPVPIAAKVGAFRPTNRGKNIKAGKTYYMIFGNPDRHVKTGEKVTVVVGDFKVKHLLVN